MANKKEQQDSDLDNVLSEVNEGIQKGKTKPDSSEKAEKAETAEKAEKSEKAEKAEKPQKKGAVGVSHLKGRERETEKGKNEEGRTRRSNHKLQEREEDLLSFSKAATIIEDGLDDQADRIYPTRQSRNVIEPPPQVEPEQEDEQDQPRHIAVTAGEAVAIAAEPEKGKKKKSISKAALKKAHGTVVSREIKKDKKTAKQKRTMVLGVFIAFFVIVGIIAAVWGTIEIGFSIATAAPLKEELAMEIFPLVIIDTPEFEDPKMLDNTAIVSASIWGFIVNEEDKSKYRRDDLGNIFVPDVDIEKHMRRLFGQEVTIKHQSVEDTSVQMVYDAENKQYVIESTPRFLPYTPRVDSIIKTGQIYTLRVSYILPTVVWNLERDVAGQPSDKILEYRLLKNNEGYQVLSVKLLEVATASDYQKSQITESEALENEKRINEELDGEASDLAAIVSSVAAASDANANANANASANANSSANTSTSADGTSSENTSSEDTSSEDTSSEDE